jgi:hypothetical protein
VDLFEDNAETCLQTELGLLDGDDAAFMYGWGFQALASPTTITST